MPEMAFPHHHHLPSWFILLTSFMLFNFSSTATSLASATNMTTAPITSKPGCDHRCGNLLVPYPFGIGRRCALGEMYEISCNKSFKPSRAFLMTTDIEVFNISEKYVKINNSVATSFYKNNLRENVSLPIAWTWFTHAQPYSFSAEQNTFMVIGCDDYAWIKGTTKKGQSLSSGCMSTCSDSSQVTNNSCTGMGCCQISVPKGLKSVNITLSRFANDTDISSFDNNSYAFLGETYSFTFEGLADLSDREFVNRIYREVPIVIDWDVGNGTKCADAKLKKATYACQGNTSCTDSESYIASGGYRCSCLPGYEGNPYLPPAGCTDIDECAQNSTHNCSHYCFNVIGSYECSCPKRHDGDGFRNGTGCVPHKNQLAMVAGLDFGGSKLIPLDQTQVTTLIQGTMGYLDPEYLHSSQLTEKSDVYSFGVVLAEILTRKKAFSFDKSMKQNNLATYFLTAIKEDHLLEVIHPQLVRETTEENLIFMATLVKRCVNLNGKDRPTMKEVAKELEGLRDNMKHPWEEPSYKEATSLMGSDQVDLYQIPLEIN